jgi:hypothetical protein
MALWATAPAFAPGSYWGIVFLPNGKLKTMANVTWIGGWAVAPERLRRVANEFLPGASHTFLPPVPGAAESAASSDWVAGWSFGAWRVMDAAARGVRFQGRVLLLAPFVAFCSEYHLGGRCSLTQVRWLRRWMQNDPMAALRDFYQRAGMNGVPGELPYAVEDLLEGLDLLAADASPSLRAFAARGVPENWWAIIGESDPLLDARAVCGALPGCEVVLGAGHSIETLLAPTKAVSNPLSSWNPLWKGRSNAV